MQADLTAEFGALPKAIDALLEALPAASKTDMEPGVELRLGKAYEQQGNAAEAEKHFLGAERTMRASHLNRVDSEDILASTGLFYSRHQKPLEAIQRFHESQRLPGQDVVNRAMLQLQVLREAVKTNAETSKQEFAAFDDLIAEVQHSTLGHGDAVVIADVQKDAKDLRERSKH